MSTDTATQGVEGLVAPGFERVRDEVASVAAGDPSWSAQVCV